MCCIIKWLHCITDLKEVWSWLIIQSSLANFELVACPLKSVFFLMNVSFFLEVWEVSKSWFMSTSRTHYRFCHSFATQYYIQRSESLFHRSFRNRVHGHDYSFSDFCFILNSIPKKRVVLCLWLLAQHTVTTASPLITFISNSNTHWHKFSTVIQLLLGSWITMYWLSGNRNSQRWCDQLTTTKIMPWKCFQLCT